MGSEKYSTHVLELVRNNGVQEREIGSEDSCFLMFDYFDVLVYKELIGENKQYRNYLSIEDTFHDVQEYKVSYKSLSLYCDVNHKENPFKIENEGRAKQIPFLGLIQISLCKENYEEIVKEPVNVDDFLKKCEQGINDILKETLADRQDKLVKQLYRSSTTGDFCLAIRTDRVEDIYNIALALNDTQDRDDKKLKLLTYTNVGIECKSLPDHTYRTLDKDFIDHHKSMVFALRFSGDAELLNILKEYKFPSSDAQKMKVAKGLFGRYDYLIHIGIDEFAEIYPVLCEKKIGSISEIVQQYDPSIVSLSNILKYPHIKNINERVLVDIASLKGNAGIPNSGKNAYLEKVIEMNRQLYSKIRKLSKWENDFSEEARAFKDLYRGMEEIYKAFSSVGAEKEAYLNWLAFYEDMNILCECIHQSMERYREKIRDIESVDQNNKRRYLLRVLRDWRCNIQAINQYTRLVQNINY